jgi:serine/threonine-protein kinase
MLRDRYRTVKMLGQGGFGATFLAADLSLPGSPPCVIKQLRLASTVPHVLEMARELFEREAETLGKVGNHPQVPRLLDYFEEDQQFYLVQDYVRGHNLQQEVKRNGPVSEASAKQFLSEVLPMIEYIHSQEVIHRDIKPANLIRREQDKKLVLIDFGAVKNQIDLAAVARNQTALTAFAVGTPGFAPPEQMAMRPVYASDIYAIGITCLYLLTGKSPKDMDYSPSTGEMLWEKYLDISSHFAQVLRKMLEVSVRHRYQTCQEVLNALNLEPYVDSLSKDMIVQPTTDVEETPSAGLASQDPTSSATSSLAASIRARKKRTTFNDSSKYRPPTGGGRYQPMETERNTGGRTKRGKSVSPPTLGNTKLDASTVINSYTKGRRDFGQQNLSMLNLQQVDLSGGIFHQSQLSRVNLQGANLANADFGRASLDKANLRDAQLGRAYFSYANLEGADLRGADLSYAYLSYAILKGANLCGANLTNAKVTNEQLALAKTNWLTIMPNGKRGLW